MRILSSTSVLFRAAAVQMPNLALIETKRITVQCINSVLNNALVFNNVLIMAKSY